MPAKKEWLKNKEVEFKEELFSQHLKDYLRKYDPSNLKDSDICVGHSMRFLDTPGTIGEILEINTNSPMSIKVKLSKKLDEAGLTLNDITKIVLSKGKSKGKEDKLYISFEI